jgi:hypothetical protein
MNSHYKISIYQLPLVIDLEMFYFRMEMIDHQQDANEIHSVYCRPSHPTSTVDIKSIEIRVSLCELTRFFLMIGTGRKCLEESSMTPR